MAEKGEYTKYEKARLIGARALQLFFGAPPLIKPLKDEDFVHLAMREFEKGVIPLKVVRK